MSQTPDDNSAAVRRSVEVEYWVVDNEGRLTAPGELVEAAAGVEREFVEPLVEIKTTPCATTAALREELHERLRAVLRRGAEQGKRLVPLATPLHATEIADHDDMRIRIQDRVVGEDFDHVRHCAGTHIHVEQQPGQVVDQLNTFIALDPALALVNSSPYYRGERVAAGARSELYRRRAYADIPHQGQLWSYVDTPAAWTRRLERRHEEFIAMALEAGFDRRTVIEAFGPESAVWTPVQRRDAFGTVEWRSPDTALPEQVIRLADRLATMTERLRTAELHIEGDEGQLTDDSIVLPTFDAVLEYTDAAISEGLADERVRSYLDRMGFAVREYEPLTRAVESTRSVTPERARQHRLEYADRLERSVRQGIDAA
jgi:gamma-glutamyl:cysteine ligase YbdK (ATP-grasp superfamily)